MTSKRTRLDKLSFYKFYRLDRISNYNIDCRLEGHMAKILDAPGIISLHGEFRNWFPGLMRAISNEEE